MVTDRWVVGLRVAVRVVELAVLAGVMLALASLQVAPLGEWPW